MIFLDTHVVIWLYEKRIDFFSEKARNTLEQNQFDLLISPMVYLELTYLKESGRITEDAEPIFQSLKQKTGMKICDRSFDTIVLNASRLIWTRDPFDRIITAQAQIGNDILITKDKIILENYKYAIW